MTAALTDPWGTRDGRAALKLRDLLSDGKPHTNAEIGFRVSSNARRLTRARQMLRDHGVALRPDRQLGEGWWVLATDAVDVDEVNVRSSRRHYSEACRLARATAGAFAAAPHDAMLGIVLAQQQAIAMQLGVRIGKTPSQIAADLVPAAAP